MSMEPWWNDIDRGKLKILEKNLSQYHFVPTQIPHGLTWAWAWASEVRGLQLTTWAKAGPWTNVTKHVKLDIAVGYKYVLCSVWQYFVQNYEYNDNVDIKDYY
jgi:hypothetical protein